MNHIREKLPDMKARLNTLMGQTQQELNSFGDLTFLGEQHRVSRWSFLSHSEKLFGVACLTVLGIMLYLVSTLSFSSLRAPSF